MACEVWPDGAPCGAPEVERLRFVNSNLDDPGEGGLGICANHMAAYLLEHMLVF